MPRYEYICPQNGVRLVVRHERAMVIRTWGELCRQASAELGATPPDAAVELIQRAACGCSAGCDHDQAPPDHDAPRRFGWWSTRMGRATSKGVGVTALSALIFTPCPCCGGVILACVRGVFSAAIGCLVGLVAYRRQPDAASR